jgi:predicted HTH domain antitoxin
MSLVLEIPDSIEEALRLPPGQQAGELFKELAVALYGRNALSFSKACELSKLDRLEFGRLLARREVPRHYGEEELERDWKYASGE